MTHSEKVRDKLEVISMLEHIRSIGRNVWRETSQANSKSSTEMQACDVANNYMNTQGKMDTQPLKAEQAREYLNL